MDRFEKTLGHIFLIIISVLITFFLIEFLSRIFLQHRQSPIERQFPVHITRYPKPYVMFGGKKGGRIYGENLNNLGYRGKAPSINKEPGEYRVFMLGGSTVLRGEPPISDLLEEEFKNNGFEYVSVYNFGISASVSNMELARIVFEVAELEPDLIIMYNGNNDMVSALSFDPRPGFPYNFMVYENNPVLESDVGSYPATAMFLYGSNLFRYLFGSFFMSSFIPLEHLRTEAGYKSEEWEERMAEIYVNNLVKAGKVSKAFGAEFIAFFQPTVYFKDQPSQEEQKALEILEERHSNAQLDTIPYRRMHCLRLREKILPKIAQAKHNDGLRAVDLSDIYDDTTEQIFTDDCHTLQEAKPVIAEEIYRNLTELFAIAKPRHKGSTQKAAEDGANG